MQKKLLERFMKNNYKKIQAEFRIEQVTNKKVGKLYVKQKGYDNSFNILIFF